MPVIEVEGLAKAEDKSEARNPKTEKASRGARTITLAEWIEEGKRRFGDSQLKWRFECPACGHSQAVEDFRPFKSQGATAETARFNCIGRYLNTCRRAFGGSGPGPCDYTSGGLFDSAADGGDAGRERIRAFDFAEVRS